jgi:sodium/bile acid cotransporter 7
MAWISQPAVPGNHFIVGLVGSRWVSLLKRQWFMICLVSVLGLGWIWHTALESFAESPALRYVIVATVLFLMALPLDAQMMWRSVRRPLAPLVGSGLNFILVPLLAWSVARFFDREMSVGLMVAAAAPCTLASASVWTRRAEGNDSVSMMITILTNMACFVVTPMLVLQTTGLESNTESLSFSRLATKLGLLVVCPMVLAQLLRRSQAVASWATEKKKILGVFAQFGLLAIVTMGAVRAATYAGEGGVSQYLGVLPWLFLAVLGIHLLTFFAGLATTKWLGMPDQDRIAVAIGGSQKTLMVGLHLSIELGVSVFPMILYHLTQLVVDTWLADWWRERTKKQKTGRTPHP